jgi:hypothetical protein
MKGVKKKTYQLKYVRGMQQTFTWRKKMGKGLG